MANKTRRLVGETPKTRRGPKRFWDMDFASQKDRVGLN